MSPRNRKNELACRILLIALGFLVVAGCNRQARYEVLTFFFTGVPPLEGTEKPSDEAPQGAGGLKQDAVARAETKTPPPLHKHKPFEEGNCSACHEANKGNRLFNEPQKLCLRCHEDFASSFPWVHGPVAVGLCNTCHESHESRNEFLLISTSREICFECHVREDIFITPYHSGVRVALCTDCHDPHGGSDRWLLKGPGERPSIPKPIHIGRTRPEPDIQIETTSGNDASKPGRNKPAA
jgi:predicted CXXCH cytochrome family protein